MQLLDGLMEKASNLTEEQVMASVRDGVPSLVVRRFNAFAMASDMQGAAHYLRGLVQMLRWICSTSSSRKTRRGYVWRGDGISTGREQTKQRKRRKKRWMAMRKHVYVDLHVLETVTPSGVNRDDTGTPKTTVYGGAVRARVSSQCWKHAMREKFRELLPQEEVGIRTKHIHALLTETIRARSPKAKAGMLAEEALRNAGLGLKDENKTGALFFISSSQLEALAEVEASADKLDKKTCQVALAVDMALFGRMVADDPSLNFDAAAQMLKVQRIRAARQQEAQDWVVVVWKPRGCGPISMRSWSWPPCV